MIEVVGVCDEVHRYKRGHKHMQMQLKTGEPQWTIAVMVSDTFNSAVHIYIYLYLLKLNISYVFASATDF